MLVGGVDCYDGRMNPFTFRFRNRLSLKTPCTFAAVVAVVFGLLPLPVSAQSAPLPFNQAAVADHHHSPDSWSQLRI